MAQATMMSLPQMVDMALNTPEVGVVNFTILHSLLHVMISQLGMTDIRVQFQGEDSDRVETFLKCAKPGTAFILTHYVVDEAENEKEKGKKTKFKPSKSPSIVLENTVGISKKQLANFENELKNLTQKVHELSELPADAKLIEALSATGQDRSPVLDMYQILNLTKRLDAVELSIEKFATILESVTRASISGESGGALATLKDLIENSTPKRKSVVEDSVEQRLAKLESAIKLCVPTGSGKHKSGPKQMSDVMGPGLTSGGSFSQFIEIIEYLKEEVSDIKSKLDGFGSGNMEIATKKENTHNIDTDNEEQPMGNSLVNMENRFTTVEEQLASLDNGFSRQVNNLTSRINTLESEVGELQEKINLFQDPNEGKAAELSLTAELHNQLNMLQDDVKRLEDKMSLLLEERDNRQHTFDVLTEQVELLKAVKADREDLEDALADKADACLINRKVSFEQFDQACGDMSRNIEEALSKLSQQEVLWTNALEDLQKDIGSKMDRMELNPLRDFINVKLKSLQEKFKTLTALKKEHEAAGTKSKFLRNVNCISCDKDVVMRKEVDPSMFPKPTALPPTRSMGPYLAYELDQLRKQQKCLPSNKNLNMFENAILAGKTTKSPDHICNRYCGGSHTVTTPQQRVARVGHFLEQWGPEIAPMNDVHVRGTDGQMYKARDDAQLKQLASEKGPSTSPEQISPFNIGANVTKKSSVSRGQEKGNDNSTPASARSQK